MIYSRYYRTQSQNYRSHLHNIIVATIMIAAVLHHASTPAATAPAPTHLTINDLMQTIANLQKNTQATTQTAGTLIANVNTILQENNKTLAKDFEQLTKTVGSLESDVKILSNCCNRLLFMPLEKLLKYAPFTYLARTDWSNPKHVWRWKVALGITGTIVAAYIIAIPYLLIKQRRLLKQCEALEKTKNPSSNPTSLTPDMKWCPIL